MEGCWSASCSATRAAEQLKPAGSFAPACTSVLGDGCRVICYSEARATKGAGLQPPAAEVAAEEAAARSVAPLAGGSSVRAASGTLNPSQLILQALVEQVWVIFQHLFYKNPGGTWQSSCGLGEKPLCQVGCWDLGVRRTRRKAEISGRVWMARTIQLHPVPHHSVTVPHLSCRGRSPTAPSMAALSSVLPVKCQLLPKALLSPRWWGEARCCQLCQARRAFTAAAQGREQQGGAVDLVSAPNYQALAVVGGSSVTGSFSGGESPCWEPSIFIS